jgi:TolB protein
MKHLARGFSALLLIASHAAADDFGAGQLLVVSIRTGNTEVFVVDPATGDARNISRTPDAAERYASWSPDGKRIVFASDRDGTYNLFICDADGSHLRQLTHEPKPVVAGMQSWPADGRWIYFGLFGKGPPQMCRIAPEGGEIQKVGEGIDPAVNPAGTRVAFARDLKGGHCLFTMNVDGTDLRQLTTKPNPWAGVHATWTPDGKQIIYANADGDSLELFSCAADGKHITQLTHFGHGMAATSPSVSPDMKWISFRLSDEIYWRNSQASAAAYREHRADKRPVWVMSIDGTNPHVIEPLHYQVTIDGSRAAWAPILVAPQAASAPPRQTNVLGEHSK